MDLVDSGQNHTDRVENVKFVLEFLAQTLCLGSPGKQPEFSSAALTGLWIILTACGDTLAKIADDAL